MSSMWLPPLNCHNHYTIHLRATQEELPSKDSSCSTANTRSLPQFAIRVHVRVRFSTYSGSDLGFEGLDYSTEEFFIPCRALIGSPANTAERILCGNLCRVGIPFRLRNVIFVQKLYGEDYSLSMAKNWVEKLQEFLLSMLKKSCHFCHNVLPLSLTIDKSIKISDELYKGWRCWYSFSEKQDPDFVKKYKAAISRPRTKEELMFGPIMTFDQATTAVSKKVDFSISGDSSESCSICLDDFSDGKVVAIVLFCGHFFHGRCIKNWFQRNQVCPLCRAPLPCRLNWVS